MNVVVAGGTGFLGTSLTTALIARGHKVVVLTREPREQQSHLQFVTWAPEDPLPAPDLGGWPRVIDGADAVVNLAGAGIADRRWSRHRKDVLRQSRLASTNNLVAAIRAAARKPSVFINGSAMGYYGTPGDQILDESFPPGEDFLATLCVDWEAHATPASALGCRVVLIRSGLPLSAEGGALKKLLPAFKFFVGGPIASGEQYMSWIHRDDWVGIVMWALEHPTVTGAINATAPSPATNREFSKAVGRAIGRPSWLPVPAFVLRVLVGEMSDAMLVRGQRVVPKRALELGYTFKYPDLDGAMTLAVAAAPR